MIAAKWVFTHIDGCPLARGMHPVRPHTAGRYEMTVVCSVFVMPVIETNPLRRGGPLRPPARIGL